MLMPAALAVAPREVRCDEIAAPEPTAGKVLVRTVMASICGSDLHIVYMGWNARGFPLPHGHPGHEGIGEVVDGGNTGFQPGDLVLTTPSIWESATFAGHQLVHPRYLLKLPSGVPPSHLLMAQQLGTVVFGCKRLPPVEGKTVAVIGQGSVGLFHDFMLRRLGAGRIIAVEPVAERLAAAARFGADDLVDVTGGKATDAVLELTAGQGADLVVEAVGSVETFNQAMQMARPLGHVAVFGLPPTMDPVPFDWNTFFRKRLGMHTVFGAQEEAGLASFRTAVDLIAAGEIDVEPLTRRRLPIDRVQEAFDLAYSRAAGALKVSVEF